MARALGSCLFPTTIGACGIAWTADAIAAVQLPETTEEGTRKRMLRYTGEAAECEPPPFVQSAIDMLDPDYGYSQLAGVGGAFIVGVGSLLLGVVLMFVWAMFPGSKDHFQKRSLNRDTEVLAPE